MSLIKFIKRCIAKFFFASRVSKENKKRKIEFKFDGHTGVFAARSADCPKNPKPDVCCTGGMTSNKEWIPELKLSVCLHFDSFGPNVPMPTGSDAFPQAVYCRYKHG